MEVILEVKHWWQCFKSETHQIKREETQRSVKVDNNGEDADKLRSKGNFRVEGKARGLGGARRSRSLPLLGQGGEGGETERAPPGEGVGEAVLRTEPDSQRNEHLETKSGAWDILLILE